MSKVVIKAENISKAYQLGQIGTGTISRDLERWYATIRGKDDPFIQVGESNTQNTKSKSDVVWSLKDINFEIEQGDAVGIIGRNGAGKSTLLKILSKVTAPTTGKISGKGRIASLLEVGTGFHPELSGRENIFLNGAILGMRKKEIQRKLDEIVDFAGIERYLDTPVKRYSSGMYVRLAFAVAAHLESEILIVDEVLAVGDAEFQKKCLGKMGEVSKGEGKTVLFVSHNMAAIRKLCNSSILLNNGTIFEQNTTELIIDKYLQLNSSAKQEIGLNNNRIGNGKVQFLNFTILDQTTQPIDIILSGSDIIFRFTLMVNTSSTAIDIGFSIHDEEDQMHTVLYSSYQDKTYNLAIGKHDIDFKLNNVYLSNRNYLIRGLIKVDGLISDQPIDPIGEIKVENGNFYGTGSLGHQSSKLSFLIKGTWD